MSNGRICAAPYTCSVINEYVSPSTYSLSMKTRPDDLVFTSIINALDVLF